MFLLLLRKLWIRRRRSDAEETSNSTSTLQDLEFEEIESHIPDMTMATASRYDDTDMIVDQLAALAASLSHKSSSITPLSTPVLKAESQPQTLNPLPEQRKEEQEEESFYHLHSLITISCLPQHKSGHTPTSSASTLGSRSENRQSQIFDRKRASSILSLHLGDLPPLPFSSTRKVSCKPSPRYTPLPPPVVHKRLAIRPEVRF
ncbi:hypothetical protein N7457_008421 [Penicillium paradoxum]|uniref:uncharacterized protein n=1 Tax=Penicillium paradoxum TaxID=176176 RepID=UPI002548948A|nr:uncharacterized protein N7457_008421 [Penicillium paradoxum]KAJ5773525.1 hypothetical protein N7457_008421 [Penicillium paradoxum]